MNRLPSEYPKKFIENPTEEFYDFSCHSDVEQSAIYSDVYFHAVGESNCGIILTPHCDIQNQTKNSYIILARLAPVLQIFNFWLVVTKRYSEDEIYGQEPIAKGKTKRINIIKDFAKTFLNNQTTAYYFLPEISIKMKHSFVCFDIIECMSIEKLSAKNKICVLKSPHREAIPSNYSAYIGRIGVPEFEEEYLIRILDNLCMLRDK